MISTHVKTFKYFRPGEIAKYKYPNRLMDSSYNLAAYHASIKSNELFDDVKSSYDNKGIYATPPKEAWCMVINHSHSKNSKTLYYKVLLGENLYWIAQEHLFHSYFRNK